MKILAIDSSAGPVSCAVMADDILLASAYGNTKLTHSQTLLPMVEDMLKNSSLSLNDVEVFAVSVGPGSFTGVRIGVSAVKGIAFHRQKLCAPVSTLEAMAYNFSGLPMSGVVCASMDARCDQIYTALFLCEDGKISRMSPDEAISLEELKIRLDSVNKSVFLIGDGAQLCYNTLQEHISGIHLAPVHLRYQQATGVAMAARRLAAESRLIEAAALQPHYLRLPQAERELRLKQEAAANRGASI